METIAQATRWAEWIDTFADELLRLGTKAERALLVDLGHEYYEIAGGSDPVAIARREFDGWPH